MATADGVSPTMRRNVLRLSCLLWKTMFVLSCPSVTLTHTGMLARETETNSAENKTIDKRSRAIDASNRALPFTVHSTLAPI